MANAMDGMTWIRQRPDQMTTDETIGAGDPHSHGRAFWPTNEYSLPGPVVEMFGNREQQREDACCDRARRATMALPGIFRESLSTTASRRLSIV